MRVFSIALVGLFVAAAAADTAAQGRGQGRGRGNQNQQNQAQYRFQAMDSNGDRVITRAEWRGSTRSFQVHDWNGDGVLSNNEVRVGARRPARPNNQPRDLDSPWGDLTVDDWTQEHYRSLDRDGNGRVTAAEWLYDRETFRRIDHNGDNWISQAEFTGDESMDDDAGDLFE